MKRFFQKYVWLNGSIMTGLFLFLDQWTKYLAVKHLKEQEPFVIWDGIFEFHYHENRGAAWGMMQGKQVFFYILTILFCLVLFYEIYRLLKNIRYTPVLYILVTLFAGTIGNFIDRIRLQYVVDFIYVKIINFPIFNLADCYITVSVVILMILIFFMYNDEEFDEMFPFFKSKNKKEE